MFLSPTIRESPNDTEGVFAFHILGEVASEDMSAMADYMNEQFDHHESVSMLLIFDKYGGSETGAGLDWSVIKSQVRALSKVDRYAVVDAPETAAKTIETLSNIIPVDARAFESEDEAWEFLGARALDRKVKR